MAISRASVAEPAACHLATIRGTVEFPDMQFTQRGAGWVFSADRLTQDSGRLFILTPAHVVWGSDRLFAQCGSNIVPLQRVGISTTLDLAVLELPQNKSRTSSFRAWLDLGQESLRASEVAWMHETRGRSWLSVYRGENGVSLQASGSPGSYAIDGMLSLSVPMLGKEEKPAVLPLSVVENSAAASPLIAMDSALIAEGVAIRPGMSGSPLIFDASSSQPRLHGMAVKTEIGSTRTLAIPLSEILQALPKLMKGEDSFREKHPASPYLTYAFHRDGSSLSRFRQLKWPGSDGPEITEICAASQFAEASSLSSSTTDNADLKSLMGTALRASNPSTSAQQQKWLEAWGVSQARDKLQIKNFKFNGKNVFARKSGGDWGDGGGSAHDPSGQYSGVPDVVDGAQSRVPPGENPLRLGSVYVQDRACVVEGLVWRDGWIANKFIDSAGFMRRLTTVDDAWRALHESFDYRRLKDAARGQDGSVEPGHPLCSSQMIGPRSVLGFTSPHYWRGLLMNNKTALAFRTELVRDGKGMDLSHIQSATNPIEAFDDGLSCLESALIIRKWDYDSDGSLMFLMLNAGKITGTVAVGNCSVQIQEPMPKTWRFEKDTPKFSFRLSLDSSGTMVRTQIFNIQPECGPDAKKAIRDGVFPWIITAIWRVN